MLWEHREVAHRDCQHCHEWLYKESGGLDHTQDGRPIRRPAGSRPFCRIPGKGCPKGTPEAKLSLTPQNRKCYQHYLECKATGRFPDDPLVTYHAGIIRTLEEQFARHDSQHLSKLIELSIGLPR